MRILPGLRRVAPIAAGVALASSLTYADGAFSADVQLQLGTLLFSEARFTEAAQAFERARDVGEGRIRVQGAVGLVRTLIRLAEFKRAEQEAERMADVAPNDAEAVAVHGEALWAAGAFSLAEARFSDALSLDPTLPRAHYGMSRSLAARGHLDEALDQALTAVNADSREGEYHHGLGYVLERLRKFDQAVVAYNNYMNLLPNRDKSEKVLWTKQHIRFLNAFGTRPPLQLSPGSENALHTVPFRLVRDKIVVQGSVNGSRPMDFVLDTGAEMTVVSQRVARRQGIEPVSYTLSAGVGQVGLRGLQVARADKFRIGTLEMTNVPVLIKNPPLRDLPTAEAESFSPPALGLSVSIDYSRKLLTLGRNVPKFQADVELPLRVHRLAMVEGLVNNQRASFVVDTGGEVISISRATLATIDEVAPPPSMRRIPLKVYGTSGWDKDAFLLPGINLAFHDTVQMPNQPVVVLNLDAPSVLLGFELGGIVGHRFLSRYQVAMDLQTSTLRLRKL